MALEQEVDGSSEAESGEKEEQNQMHRFSGIPLTIVNERSHVEVL
jgi:hypothetical protein